MKFLILACLLPLTVLARPVRGTYEVPAPEELKPFATFPVKFKSEEYDNGERAITFPLPAQLTGETLNLSMAETSPGIWTGDNITANCAQSGRFFECKMTFQNLPIDSAKVEEVLRQNYPLEADLRQAIELADRFKAEPAGILRYKLRGRDQQ